MNCAYGAECTIESIDSEIYECEHPDTIDYMEQYYRQLYFEDALDWE